MAYFAATTSRKPRVSSLEVAGKPVQRLAFPQTCAPSICLVEGGRILNLCNHDSGVVNATQRRLYHAGVETAYNDRFLKLRYPSFLHVLDLFTSSVSFFYFVLQCLIKSNSPRLQFLLRNQNSSSIRSSASGISSPHYCRWAGLTITFSKDGASVAMTASEEATTRYNVIATIGSQGSGCSTSSSS
jgi:hypothetical protein